VGVVAVMLIMGCRMVLRWKKRPDKSKEVANAGEQVWAANLYVPTGRIRPIDVFVRFVVNDR
jgi:hypothetical protein